MQALTDEILTLLHVSPTASEYHEWFLTWAKQVLERERGGEEPQEPGGEDQEEAYAGRDVRTRRYFVGSLGPTFFYRYSRTMMSPWYAKSSEKRSSRSSW